MGMLTHSRLLLPVGPVSNSQLEKLGVQAMVGSRWMHLLQIRGALLSLTNKGNLLIRGQDSLADARTRAWRQVSYSSCYNNFLTMLE
jgi:hypothetical protein